MINIEKFLEEYIKNEDKIILACSTWPDSIYILNCILKTKYKDNLVVCYFNHKTRKWTDNEEKFINKLWIKKWFTVEVWILNLCEKNNISIWFEEFARIKRYEFLNNILEKYNWKYIITWHHLDDKIETFFFNLVRGSKLTGLINMTEKSWKILRPLLNLTKNEILDYLDRNNLEYKIDETNLDTDITRNYLRHEIIPKFENINWNYKEKISKTINYFEKLKKHLDQEVNKFLSLSFKTKTRTSNNWNFEIIKFNSLSSFLQKEVIRHIFYISNNNSTIWLSESNIKEIIRFINWKNNKTIKEIKWLKMKKDNKIIKY